MQHEKLYNILAPDDSTQSGRIIAQATKGFVDLHSPSFNICEDPNKTYKCDNDEYRDELFPIFVPRGKSIIGYATYQIMKYKNFINREMSFASTHVFLFRMRNGRKQILISRRGEKSSHTGKWDMISGGGWLNYIDVIVSQIPDYIHKTHEESQQLALRTTRKLTANAHLACANREPSEELILPENFIITARDEILPHTPFNKGWTRAFLKECNTDIQPKNIQEVSETDWIDFEYLRGLCYEIAHDFLHGGDMEKHEFTGHSAVSFRRLAQHMSL